MSMPSDLSAFREIPKGHAYPEPVDLSSGSGPRLVKLRFYLGGRKYGATFLTDDPSELARTAANLSGTLVQWGDGTASGSWNGVWQHALPDSPWLAA